MNPFRITLLLAILVVGVGGYILVVDIPKSQQLEKQATEERQILPFDDRDITHITWSSPRETIRLERSGQWRWEIVDPIRSPADAREIRRILRALTIGKIKRHIEDGQTDLSSYGLKPPYLTLLLTTPTDKQELALGDAGPFAPSLYVQTKPDNQVVLTTLDVMTFAQKSLSDFRLKDLFFFDRDRVLEVHIQKDPMNIVLTRVAGVHSLTPNWILKNPVQGPADKTAVGTLLMDLSGLAATGFVDAEEEKTRILRQPVRAQATIKVLEGERSHHLKVFQFQGSEKAYASRSPEGPLYEIPPDILHPITQGLFYFQGKRLFGMEANELALLSVQTPDEQYVLIQQLDEWILEDHPSIEINQEVVKLFVSRIVDLPAEISHPDSSSISQSSGLASPGVTLVGINRQGQEAGRISLGKREKGLVFAKGAGLPGIYQVRSTILDQIPTKDELVQQPSSGR